MGHNSMLFIDLPSDVLFWIFSECDALDVLSLLHTCKQLRQATDEYQVWLDQARRLEIPIPSGTSPSKAELKNWVISRTRVDVCWTKPRPGELSLHLFETDAKFVDAHFIPGGEFVVILYSDGAVGLNKIERSAVTGDLKVREVARYEDTTANDYPGSCKLLTETSYGCPVLIWVGIFHWEDPFVFLIDPVSQVIERKYHMHCDFDIDGALDLWKILAIKDRMFFILDDVEETIWITVVAEPGPKAVTKRFGLTLPVDDNSHQTRVFVVSENCLVVTNHLGIWLYHIPDLRTVGEDTRLVPAWGRSLNASDCRGTFYKTASPYPSLWLQGKYTTHTLEFGVDESGCYPVVVNHQITKGRPAFYVGNEIKLQGRKGMGIEAERRGEIVFNTGILGKPDTRRLRAPIPGLNDGPRLSRDEVKYTDLDEVTGRIMVVVGPVPGRGQDDIPCARRLYIADLPN